MKEIVNVPRPNECDREGLLAVGAISESGKALHSSKAPSYQLIMCPMHFCTILTGITRAENPCYEDDSEEGGCHSRTGGISAVGGSSMLLDGSELVQI